MLIDKELELNFVDVACIIFYFFSLFLVSFITSKNQQRGQQDSDGSTDNYFLASKNVPFYAVSASLFASNIGAEHFVGLCGTAAEDGVGVAWFEVGAVLCLILLAHFFYPVYSRAKIDTTPTYLEKRYDTTTRSIVVGVSLTLYIFTKVSATLYAGVIIITELTKINEWVSVVLLIGSTAVYTVSGGLEAVIYTELLQTVILLFGGFIVLFFTMSASGSYFDMKQRQDNFENIPENYFKMFHSNQDVNFPWIGQIFGYYAFSIWYWSTDQVIVQRVLAAKNVIHGQFGTILAGFLKLLPFFLMVMPGISGRFLLESENVNSVNSTNIDYDTVYPLLVKSVVPIGFRGLIISGMLASLMSSLASVFNSSSTLFSLNIWKVLNPNASEKQLVNVGRLCVVAIAFFSLLWLPVMKLMGKRLFLLIQGPPSYVAPPITAIYTFGMISRVPNSKGANLTLILGILVGVLRFILEIIQDTQEGIKFGAFVEANFMVYALVSFIISTIVLFSSSIFYQRVIKHAQIRYEQPIQDSIDDDDEIVEEQDELKDYLFHRNLVDKILDEELKTNIELQPMDENNDNDANFLQDEQFIHLVYSLKLTKKSAKRTVACLTILLTIIWVILIIGLN